MGKGIKIGIVVLAIGVLAGGIAWALGGSNDNQEEAHDHSTHSHGADTQNRTAQQNSNDAVAETITYTSNGFSPNTITVKSGDKVKITNESGSLLEFSSDPHPSHTINSELNAGDTGDGQSTTITVTKSGKWGFHNHYNASHRGSITVE